jgi:dsRNA-specific ribonuclease
MSRTSVKPRAQFSDIAIFYPQRDLDGNKVKYRSDVHYSREVLDSFYSRETCKILANNIESVLQEQGESFIFAWSISSYEIPMLLELLSREITLFLVLVPSDSDCAAMISEVTSLLKLDKFCALVRDIDIKGLIYVSSNIPAYRPDTPGGYIVISTSGRPRDKIVMNKKMSLFQLEDRKINMTIELALPPFAFPNKSALAKLRPIRDFSPPAAAETSGTSSSDEEVRVKPKRVVTVKSPSSSSEKIPTKKLVLKIKTKIPEEEKKPAIPTKKARAKSESSEEEFIAKPLRPMLEYALESRISKSGGGKGKSHKSSVKDPEARPPVKPPPKIKPRTTAVKASKSESPKTVMSTSRTRLYAISSRVDKPKIAAQLPEKGGWIEMVDGEQIFSLYGTGELPVPSDIEGENFMSELADYVVFLVDLFNTNPNFSSRTMVQPKYMGLWLQVFTHETRDLDKNYEDLETVGDSALAYCFKSFLCQKYKRISNSEITSVTANIASKPSLKQVAQLLNMDKWLRLSPGIRSNTNTAEDMFEAFCAVLQIVGTDIMQPRPEGEPMSYNPGMGMSLVSDLVSFLFQTVVIIPLMFMGDPKTLLNQSVEGIDKKAIKSKLISNKDNRSSIYTMILSWSDEAMEFFEQNDIDIDREIARATSSSEKAVSSKVYNIAIVDLENKGFTIAWFRKIKEEIKLKRYDPDLMAAVLAKLRSTYGEDSTLDFYTPKSLNTNSGIVVQLRAISTDADGKLVKTALSVASDPKDSNSAGTKALQLYLAQD